MMEATNSECYYLVSTVNTSNCRTGPCMTWAAFDTETNGKYQKNYFRGSYTFNEAFALQ